MRNLTPPTASKRPLKRSLTLNGHKTSVSLEEPFWRFFSNLAKEQNKTVNALAVEVDVSRHSQVGLATSIRLFCLEAALNGRSKK